VSDFTITEVLGQEPFQTEHGQFVAYEVRFEGEDGNGVAQHNRKSSSPMPTIGEVIDAEIIHKGDRTTLKKIWKPAGVGASNGGGRSPQDTKQIVRQHSQHMSIMWTAILQKEGNLKPDALTPEGLTRLTDWFQADAEGTA
jgi:hypothetical protein